MVIISIICLSAGILAPALCHAQRDRQTTSRTNSRQSQQKMMEGRQKQFEEQAARQKAEREKWMAERQKEFEQRAKDRANGKDDRRNETIRQALKMTEVQWKVVEPKINRMYFLQDQSQISIGIGGEGTGGYAIGFASSSGSSGGYRTGGKGGYGSGAMVGYGSGSSSSSESITISTGTDKGDALKTQTSSGGGGSGGGGVRVLSGPLWRYADRELTEGEKSCERLKKLLEDKNSQNEQIEQEIVVLCQARENAAKELAKARQELCELLTTRQQARLVLSGLLDRADN
jgi:hypothetical protein